MPLRPPPELVGPVTPAPAQRLVPERFVRFVDGLPRYLGERAFFGLLLLATLTQLTLIDLGRVDAARLAKLQDFATITPWAYALAALTIAPVWWHRRHPRTVFLVTTAAALLYGLVNYPPTATLPGPLLAACALAMRRGARRVLPVTAAVVLLALAAVGYSFVASMRVGQLIASAALLLAAALVGDVISTRRELRAETTRTVQAAAAQRHDEERLMIAREVHDIMAHSLTLMTVQADAGLVALQSRPAFAGDALTAIAATGRASLLDLRSLLDVLTGPGDTEPTGPVADLAGLGGLADAVRETGLDVEVRTEGRLDAVPRVTAVAAHRIVQEALTNVVRHAGARRAWVLVDVEGDEAVVRIEDDGRAVEPPEPGRGLTGMRERALAVGGDLDVATRAGGGLVLTARLPLARTGPR